MSPGKYNTVLRKTLIERARMASYQTMFVTQRVSHVEQELLTLPEHLSSPPSFSGVRVARYLDCCVMFVDHCLSFCSFIGHCIVCHSLVSSF